MSQLVTIIKARRLELGYSQGDLASIIGTTQTVISRWETGLAGPSPKMRDHVARALGGFPHDYDPRNPDYMVTI